MISLINFLYVTFVKLILEVFGAIWGTSEVLTLRNPDTQEIWRYISSIIRFFYSKKLYQRINIEENTAEIIDF